MLRCTEAAREKMKLITTKINGKAYYLLIDAKVRDQQIGKFVASPGHQATLKGLTRKVSQQDYRLSVARVLHMVLAMRADPTNTLGPAPTGFGRVFPQTSLPSLDGGRSLVASGQRVPQKLRFAGLKFVLSLTPTGQTCAVVWSAP